MREQAIEMYSKVTSTHSYDEALMTILEYVDEDSGDDEDEEEYEFEEE